MNDSIRIPAQLNGETSLLKIGPVPITLRQVVTVGSGAGVWVAANKALVAPLLGMLLGVTPGFALFVTFWFTMLPAFAFAFYRVHGRQLDRYLGDWFAYRFEPQTFLPSGADGDLEPDIYNDPDMERFAAARAGRRM